MARSTRLPRVLRAGVLVAGWSLVAFPAAAQAPDTTTTVPPAAPTSAPETTTTTAPASATDPATIGDDRVLPQLLGVAVESLEYDQAMVGYRTIAVQLDQARATFGRSVDALVELDAQQIRLRRQLTSATQRHAVAEREVATFQDAIDELAVATYVLGGSAGAVADATDWQDATDEQARRAVTDAVLQRNVAELARASDDRDRAARDRDRTRVLLDSVTARRDETLFVRDSSQAAAFVLASELEEQRVLVADARLTATVVGTDFPFLALDAYVRAADTLNAEQPACRIRWQVLAGIARTESRHGSYGGSEVQGDGTVDPPIVGIALDGTNNTARVPDSDGGQWDGDAVYDRAVGPMQFIPSSWRYYAADGNLDGDLDPHDYYDATQAAGRLLCRNSSGYDTAAGLERGLLSYNHSVEYGRVVAGYVRGYDELDLFDPTAS
jgi:membrane-bound lytic murein transglycosylase B